MEGIRRALVLDIVLIAVTAIEQASSVDPLRYIHHYNHDKTKVKMSDLGRLT